MLAICAKALYHLSFLILHRIRALGLTIHQGLISNAIQTRPSRQIQEKE